MPTINPITFDYSRLKNFHRAALLQYVGVSRHEASNIKTKTAAVARLVQEAERNPDRMRQGIEAIVFGKADTANVPEDIVSQLEAKTMALLRDFNADEASRVAEQRVSQLLENVEKEVIRAGKEAVQKASENYRPIVIKDGAKTRKVKGVLPAEFEQMVQLASQRIPIYLVGPAGCGKTYLAGKLAEALGVEYSDQSCSEGMSESVFNGRLLPIGKGGEFKHVPSPFMTRYEKGGVMLLDEIDAGDSNLFTYMNKAVANESYTAEQRFENPVVKKHRDFILVAAANTFGSGGDAMYVGRNQLDAATLDRFQVGMICMDYSREVELSIAPQELCEWAWRIRDLIQANKLRRIMSTRVIKNLAAMTLAYGWTEKEWAKSYFMSWSEAERKIVGAGV